MPNDLKSWLSYIENLHPKSIAMGLERSQQVLAVLGFKIPFKIITVGGTNGKGSTCAMLAQIYAQAGYRVGCYTSPHLMRYNERVRVNLQEVSDADLCTAFAAIEIARVKANVALTYFEVGTLAAMWHFMTQSLDIVILEVGLGGRLDTVNTFDADCAIVTSIDLDHQEFLGNTREKIAFEKAAIYRPNTPAICGDNHPPGSLVDYAKAINANFLSIHEAFAYSESAAQQSEYWTFHTHALLEQCMLKRQKNAVQSSEFMLIFELPVPNLSGHYQLNNAACAIAAVQTLQTYLPVALPDIAQALLEVTLAGRFQTVLLYPHVILDVAHNPHAARALNANLQTLISPNVLIDGAMAHDDCKIIAVFAMLVDKDIQGVVDTLAPVIDAWFVAPIDHVRGASIDDLSTALLRANVKKNINTFSAVDAAYSAAIIDAETRIEQGENVKIIVFGSFFTVAAVMEVIASKSAD